MVATSSSVIPAKAGIQMRSVAPEAGGWAIPIKDILS
jgi:hypothetical protein